MFGVRPIEMLVQIVLSLRAVTYNLYKHFCLAELLPKYRVACSSNDMGKDVKAACDTGCIGCKICEKQCQFDAIHVENNLAKIDYEKCKGCGACAAKCPSKIILKA